MKKFIVADFSNFSSHGGIEKNAEIITRDIEKILNLKIKKTKSKSQILIIFLKSLLKIKSVKYFICYKNSILTGLLFKLTGSKLIIRVNNSPESYLYWNKLKSLISYFLKIKLVKSEIILFNSRKIMNFYKIFSSGNKNLYFLENNYSFDQININLSKSNKIYCASRMSWEKNLLDTHKILKSISKDIDYEISAYSTSKIKNLDIKNFEILEYNFNDIYISLSFFEGMPNMAFQALFKGSALLLSNCWSHVEIYNLLSNFGLENRINIISQDFKDKSNLINEIKSLQAQIENEDIEIFKKKVLKLRQHLLKNYKKTINEICMLIN